MSRERVRPTSLGRDFSFYFSTNSSLMRASPTCGPNSSRKMQRNLGKLEKLSRASDVDPGNVLERGGEVGSRYPDGQ